METGGGDRYPKNYCEWDKRDAALFPYYASVRKEDNLAWIYMLDKKKTIYLTMLIVPLLKRL